MPPIAKPAGSASSPPLQALLLLNESTFIESAKELLTIGESPKTKNFDPIEHAALANVLLNLNEVITKK